MEVSDSVSINLRVLQNKPIKITKLKLLKIDNEDWSVAQCNLLADAIKESTSLTAIEFHLENYNLVYLLQSILPNHPTIRSVTMICLHSSRFVELAPIEKMIKESHWTEFGVQMTELDSVIDDTFAKMCRGLAANTTIKNLDLSKQPLDYRLPDLLDMLKVNNTIDSLFLSDTNCGGVSALWPLLEQKENLVAFGIGDAYFYKKDVSSFLRTNTSLTHLELFNAIVNGARDILDMIHNNQLKSLVGDFYGDMDEFCKALLKNTSMTRLEMTRYYYTNWGLINDVIKVHPALEQLTINLDEADEDTVTRLFDALKHNTKLTDLDLSGCAFDFRWRKNKDVLNINKTLRHLALSDFGCLDGDGKYLAEMLRNNTTLRGLSFCKCLPEQQEFMDLCQGLRENKSLTSLTFSTDEGMSSKLLDILFNALSDNTTLRTLTIDTEDLKFSETYSKDIYCKLNIEWLIIKDRSKTFDQELLLEIDLQGFERKISRRREVTNLIISLFSIARRPESFVLFPREIWLKIFTNIHTGYLDIAATAQAIFEDKTLRKMIDFDKDELRRPPSHYS
jgi:ribonuclease BN (tRNA processing enzyme)